MSIEHSITPENFRLLLSWLNSNEELAGAEYERIRQRLIRIFVCRGCFEAESLADETIDRVAFKAPEITNGYIGNPANYFYGVANKIHLEWLRKQERNRRTLFVDLGTIEQSSDTEFECLESCIDRLSPSARELILEYYRDEKRAKIDRRKKLAAEMKISIGALQIRTSRLRATLLDCVTKCLSGSEK